LATTQRPLSQLRPLAQSALADSPIFDMRMLAVEVTEDALVLSGSVSSFYHKQMAQELVRTIVGRDVEVINSISVR
jgi:osmotically-inducible protein OsmY